MRSSGEETAQGGVLINDNEEGVGWGDTDRLGWVWSVGSLFHSLFPTPHSLGKRGERERERDGE